MPSSKPLILVVDDDQPIVALMRAVLREFGFEALTALNGPEALAASRAQRLNLVLLDRNMPGMTGDEVVRALRAEPHMAGVPILILSGDPLDDDELARMGADGAVQKPFDVVALIEQIRSYTGA